MKVLDVLKRFKQTTLFKEWHRKNKEAKLVHVFIMLDPGQEVKYDIGFYDYSKKLMTSFTVDEALNDIQSREDKEVFKKPGDKINPLDESRLRICFNEACAKCRQLQNDKYRQHTPIKEVVILQNLDCGQVWNITYITKTFQTLNMKVDAETGDIVEEKLHQIFSFDK
ncbi:hypothetical protein JW898_06015 [Candidatus Woesearchaeota archaeon]|nr:hypothetical protein [Candidatus Woesearchaeota archaeon]